MDRVEIEMELERVLARPGADPTTCKLPGLAAVLEAQGITHDNAALLSFTVQCRSLGEDEYMLVDLVQGGATVGDLKPNKIHCASGLTATVLLSGTNARIGGARYPRDTMVTPGDLELRIIHMVKRSSISRMRVMLSFDAGVGSGPSGSATPGGPEE